MSGQLAPNAEIWTLFDAACADQLDADQVERLDAVLRADPRLRDLYLDYFRLHAELLRSSRLETARGKIVAAINRPQPAPAEPPIAINLYSPLSTLHSPLSTNFVGGPVFSYIAATLILGVMLLGAWAYKISHDYGESFVHNSRGSTTPGLSTPQRPELVFVARVTGMKNCRWADPATETFAGAYVPLGRKYSLSSGLMEITYFSGAKAILEGPCRYEVESSTGGYLALGKLTAKVEKRSEVRDRRSEAGGLAASAASVMPQTSNLPSPNGRGVGGEGNGNQKQSALTLTLSQRERGPDPSPKTQDPRPKTEISKSPNLQISKFTVRTPTAVVTDLGTEFGVAVAANGDTTSHVFQGRVVVQSLAAASTRREPSPKNPKSQIPNQQILLAAGQSALVAKDAATGVARITTGEQAVAPPKFVRRLYEPPKLLDLLDIVAGGNGLGNRRERGIDPVYGRIDPEFTLQHSRGCDRYNPTPWSRLIDGVFVPDGEAGAVQLDSAGHTYDGFPATSGAIWAVIWSRGAKYKPELTGKGWIYQIDQDPQFGRQFMPEGRGLLGIHPNAGITFNLEAMRAMYRGMRPARFRATAGMADARPWDPDADGMADLWVFVDGSLKWKRAGIRPKDGAATVDLEIGPKDGYLTIVSTDGNGDNKRDWVVFGDPVLELTKIGEQ